jgi:pantetheine-phosphate adenylyltransferase
MTKACYPGSFDPVTNGHLDVIERACRVFDEVVVAVSGSPSNLSKHAWFTIDERMDLLTEVTKHLDGLKVMNFQGLLVEFCRRIGANAVVKGLRTVSDFDYEMQMAQMNARMGIETVFVVAGPKYSYLSSSLMKEVVSLGGDVEGLVPPLVERRLEERAKERSKR